MKKTLLASAITLAFFGSQAYANPTTNNDSGEGDNTQTATATATQGDGANANEYSSATQDNSTTTTNKTSNKTATLTLKYKNNVGTCVGSSVVTLSPGLGVGATAGNRKMTSGGNTLM